MFYKNEKINGLVTAYYSTGKVKYKANYKMGVLYGEYKAFNQNGDCVEKGFIDEINDIFDIKRVEIKKENNIIKRIETSKPKNEKIITRENRKEEYFYKIKNEVTKQTEEPEQNFRTENSSYLRYDEILKLREKRKKSLGIIDFKHWRDMFDLIDEIKAYIENGDMERAVNKILILSNIDKQLVKNDSAVEKNLSILLKEINRLFKVKSKE